MELFPVRRVEKRYDWTDTDDCRRVTSNGASDASLDVERGSPMRAERGGLNQGCRTRRLTDAPKLPLDPLSMTVCCFFTDSWAGGLDTQRRTHVTCRDRFPELRSWVKHLSMS